ncbi:DUF4158 domain-containing protein [Streptomyces nodosus]|uniref:DUF4158 domain-containing protein n=1 Tax=Streptomyces nodosus TaxID=40318 RepID=UPI0037FCF12E
MIETNGAGVRQEWSPEELLANWTLVDGDWDLVANKSGTTRLGFSLFLKFFELEGRFPDVLEEVPPAAVEYVADLVRRRRQDPLLRRRRRRADGRRGAQGLARGGRRRQGQG